MKAESQYAICEGAVLCSDSRVGSHQRSTADWRSAACVCLCVIIIYQAASLSVSFTVRISRLQLELR